MSLIFSIIISCASNNDIPVLIYLVSNLNLIELILERPNILFSINPSFII